jgi:hypothetical protein
MDQSCPENHVGGKDSSICGISEYAYDIPLSYRILVSQDTKVVRSRIWDYEGTLAIQGDYIKGQQKLYEFLDTLKRKNRISKSNKNARNTLWDEAELVSYIEKTKAFLDAQDNAKQLFHLENGEIYAMEDDDIVEQNTAFYHQKILKIDDAIEAFFEEMEAIKKSIIPPPSFFKGLFTKKQVDSDPQVQKRIDNLWASLGIQDWSSILYYDLG